MAGTVSDDLQFPPPPPVTGSVRLNCPITTVNLDSSTINNMAGAQLLILAQQAAAIVAENEKKQRSRDERDEGRVSRKSV